MRKKEVKFEIKFNKADQSVEVNGEKFEVKDIMISEDEKLELTVLNENEREKQIEEMTQEISKKIMASVDPKEFVVNVIREALKKEARDRLNKIQTRLENKKARVKAKKHCYAIMIGGKSGPPLQLDLVGV